MKRPKTVLLTIALSTTCFGAWAAINMQDSVDGNAQPVAVVQAPSATAIFPNMISAPAPTAQAVVAPVNFRGLAPLRPNFASSTAVTPINWGTISATAPLGPTGPEAVDAKKILANANKYGLTTWWNEVKNFDAQGTAPAYLNLGSTQEDYDNNIRQAASEALALAVALKTGAYNDQITGVSSTVATAKAVLLIKSVARSHKANNTNGAGWGADWQTALWANFAGTAGWLLWDELKVGDSTADQELVRKMVEYEADLKIGFKPQYYRDATGTIISTSDTKAEENAWNGSILHLAFSMMPAHPNYRAWMYKDVELIMTSYARPADQNSTASNFNGRSFADWINGSNANNDFMVVNHYRVHPDYAMSSITTNLNDILLSGLGQQYSLEAARVNAAGTYDMLVNKDWKEGATYPDTYEPGNTSKLKYILAPGGTIFNEDPAKFFNPQGNDYGPGRRINAYIFLSYARELGLDTNTSPKASSFEKRYADFVLAQQARSAQSGGPNDGRTYIDDSEDNDRRTREENVAYHAARAWLAKWVKANGLVQFTNENVPIVIDNKDVGYSDSGTWTASFTSTEQLGTGHKFAAAGNGSSKARFTVNLPKTGTYNVYGWWSASATNASDAKFTIRHQALLTTVAANQRISGRQWNLLGTWTFNAGQGQYVELNNLANGTVRADGVMFIAQ